MVVSERRKGQRTCKAFSRYPLNYLSKLLLKLFMDKVGLLPMMRNDSGSRLLVVVEETGETIDIIDKGEGYNVRSAEQVNHDQDFKVKKFVSIRGKFVKMMEEEQELIDRYLKKPSVYLAYCKMKKYLVPNYNVLLKNGKRYKVADLAEDLQVSRQMASLYVRDLKNDNVICEIETHNKGFLFAINPWYACNGEKCDELVVKAFEKQAEELAEKKKKQNS